MQLFRSIFSLCLAFLILVSSVGVPVRQHFCGEKLMNWSILKAVEGCGMPKAAVVSKTCGQHPEASFHAKSCCADKTLVAEADDFTSTHAKTCSGKVDHTFVAAFTAVHSTFFSFSEPNYTVVPPYSPPLIARDIPVLVQSFLI